MSEPDSDIPSEIDHRRHPRPGHPERDSYTDEQRTFALAVYAETGSFDAAAKETGTPRNTIRYWVESNPEIDATLDALRRVIRERVAWKYAEAAELAASELLDRLRNGDELIDKEGNSYRRKVPARELAFIASICTDKHALLSGTMTKTGKEDQALTTLVGKLVTEFEARRLKARAIDAPTYPQAAEPGSA